MKKSNTTNPIHNIKVSSFKIYYTEYNFVIMNNKTYIMKVIEINNKNFEYLINIDCTLEHFKKKYTSSILLKQNQKNVNNININNSLINKNYINKMIILEKGKELNIDGDKYIIHNIEFKFDGDFSISLSVRSSKNFLKNKDIPINLETLSKYIKIDNVNISNAKINNVNNNNININNNKNIKNNINLNKIYLCKFQNLELYLIEGNLYIINNESLIDLSSIISITDKNIKIVEEIEDDSLLTDLKLNDRIYKGSYVYKKFDITNMKNIDINKKMKANKKRIENIEIDFDRNKIYLIFENSSTKNNAEDYIPYPYYTKNGYNIFDEVIIKNNNKKEKKIINNINQKGNVIIYTIDGNKYNKNSIEKFDPKKHIVKNKHKTEGYIYGKSFRVGDFVYLTTDKLKKKYIVKSVPTIGSIIGIKLFNSTSNTLQSADKEILHHYDILKVGDKVRVNSDDPKSKPKEITSEKKIGLPPRRKTVYELNNEKGLWYSEDSLIVINSKKINKNIKYENKPIKKVQYKGALKEVEEVIKPMFYGNVSFKLKGIKEPVPKKNINKIIYNNGPKKGIISNTSAVVSKVPGRITPRSIFP